MIFTSGKAMKPTIVSYADVTKRHVLEVGDTFTAPFTFRRAVSGSAVESVDITCEVVENSDANTTRIKLIFPSGLDDVFFATSSSYTPFVDLNKISIDGFSDGFFWMMVTSASPSSNINVTLGSEVTATDLSAVTYSINVANGSKTANLKDIKIPCTIGSPAIYQQYIVARLAIYTVTTAGSKQITISPSGGFNANVAFTD
jgi:hypothetical protein